MPQTIKTLRQRWGGGHIEEYRKSTASFAPKQQFESISLQNKPLITAFHDSLSTIKDHLTGNYLFLLTDAKGVLLAMDYSDNLKQTVAKSKLRLGMYFTEKSCGVNAISAAMASNGPVYLLPEQHGSPLFQSWHCFSTPLEVNGETVGYLDVSTINADMKSELIAIAKLIPTDMLFRYDKQQAAEDLDQGLGTVKLTERQLKVLQLISQGMKVKAIALKLKIKESTVNHHKRMIFEKLGVQSSTEAVSIASKCAYL
ncbi:helix-turn-helix domain-containing protein [Paenibacillus sp. Leaf72]|uniref:helix-turn-helix domain-containing protein n=1 Tax=Paenibacillus sp. Leaf72 TaxID=1736234 RepID=UPI0006FCE0CB|nr:helix-turn-helix transcriptional regulator [Paenibacillus sp. Leaf72]KQO18281.1 hypothetical protein ASF12_06530 [Paenibacillus sp. Leaf72]